MSVTFENRTTTSADVMVAADGIKSVSLSYHERIGSVRMLILR